MFVNASIELTGQENVKRHDEDHKLGSPSVL